MRIVEVLHTAAAAAVASFIIGTGSGVGASAQEIIAPDGSYPDGYNFSPEHRAGILAHSSIVLKNEKHHWLVFDGGIGKFKTEINGKNVIIPDLSKFVFFSL